MKKNWILLAAGMGVLAWAVFFSSCQREPVYVGSLLGGGDPIDTTVVIIDTTTYPQVVPCSPDSVYFEQQVLPILTSNCAMSGCHDAQSHSEGVTLTNYNTVRTTGKISTTNPTNSKLYRSITTNSGDRMPPSPRTPLTADEKALILKWMQQGALDLHCGECDTTSVKFSTVIMPLISTRCKGCHGTINPGGNIRLTNYAEVKAQITNNKLWGSIIHAAGFKPMPYPEGSALMPDCQIAQIRIWIQNGALND